MINKKKTLIFTVVLFLLFGFLFTIFLKTSIGGQKEVGSKERAIAIARNLPDVKRFLQLYPEAEIYVKQSQCGSEIALCQDPVCDTSVDEKLLDYYIVEFREENFCFGIAIRDKGALVSSMGLVEEEEKFSDSQEYVPIDFLYNDKLCYNDEDCKCWSGCGCDIPPERECECNQDEAYCLNSLYVLDTEEFSGEEECKCVDSICVLTDKE